MWADYLSHFSEIGMVEGAESYQIIKQKPDNKTAAESLGDELSEIKNNGSQSARNLGHNRRISGLDNVEKFQAQLDCVKVRSRSGSLHEHANPIKEEDDEEEQKHAEEPELPCEP